MDGNQGHNARYWHTRFGAICLRPCYVVFFVLALVCLLRAGCTMSGTDIACVAVTLRPGYAMSGTDLAYAATRSQHSRQT
eukprot:1063074-Rhodomonas_salina.4